MRNAIIARKYRASDGGILREKFEEEKWVHHGEKGQQNKISAMWSGCCAYTIYLSLVSLFQSGFCLYLASLPILCIFSFCVCGFGVQGGVGHIAYLLYNSPSTLNGNFINNGYLWLLSRLNSYLTGNEIIYSQFLYYNYTHHN